MEQAIVYMLEDDFFYCHHTLDWRVWLVNFDREQLKGKKMMNNDIFYYFWVDEQWFLLRIIYVKMYKHMIFDHVSKIWYLINQVLIIYERVCGYYLEELHIVT